MSLPNCKYCGKFCNPKSDEVVTEEVYGFMGIDDIIFYHKTCKEKLNSEQNPEECDATDDDSNSEAGKQKKTQTYMPLSNHEKEQLEHWLIHNLQITSKSNVELIIKHVDHYYITPARESGRTEDREAAKPLVEALGRILIDLKNRESTELTIIKLSEALANYNKK